MTKKRIGLICLSLLIVLLAIAGYTLWAVQQVPDFYEEAMAAEIDPRVRKAEAKKFTQQTSQLVSDIQNDESWSQEFTQLQVNSWFIEELDGKYADLLPDEAKDPRVKIDGDAVLLGFKYSHGSWEGRINSRSKSLPSKPVCFPFRSTVFWSKSASSSKLRVGACSGGS